MLYCINVSINFSVGNGIGQFTAAPATCPGDTFTFNCTVHANMSGITIWRVNHSECVLLLTSTNDVDSMCGPNDDFTARPGTGFGTNGTSFSSTLSGTANFTLNGTLVECFGPGIKRVPENRVGHSALKVLGQYALACIL